jgi:hypothetical protein
VVKHPYIFTVDEFKAIFRIANSTFWLWAKQGKFRLIRVGRRTYVPSDELHRLISTKQVTPSD